MIKVCIESKKNENTGWISLPNGDIKTAISDIMGDTEDWAIIMLVSTLRKNSFLLCNLIELNELLLELEEDYHFDVDDVSNLSLLNMLLEDRHHNINEVGPIIKDGEYVIYRNVEDMGDIARKYLEETSLEYAELKAANSVLLEYIDYKSYGEEVLMESEQYLIDEENKIIVNMYIL